MVSCHIDQQVCAAVHAPCHKLQPTFTIPRACVLLKHCAAAMHICLTSCCSTWGNDFRPGEGSVDLKSLQEQQSSSCCRAQLSHADSTILHYTAGPTCTPSTAIHMTRHCAARTTVAMAAKHMQSVDLSSLSDPFWAPRADYKKLGVLKQQFPDTPIIALTATATMQVCHSLLLC